MDVATVEEFLGLFERHPVLAVLALVLVFGRWVIKTDALGFVARSKRRRREEVFDTYEKLLAVGGASDEELASLRASLRESGEGLNYQFPSGDVPKAASGQTLSPVGAAVVRAADLVFWSFAAVMGLFLAAGFICMTIFGFWSLANSGGDLSVLFLGLMFGPGGVFFAVAAGPWLVRDSAKEYPRILEGVDWFERRTARAVALGKTVGLPVVILGCGLYFLGSAVFVASESETLLGWSLAVALGLLGIALPVKLSVKFLGLFRGRPGLGPEASG